MRIDGTTCASTHLDDETGALILRRLHPRIASYNDLVMFLMKCNMEFKFIGSGEVAKALLYYITDYITKASLPMHDGLGALSYAIQRTNEKFPQMVIHPETGNHKGALTIAVNRMISRQEVSHQQIMSYVVGGGDTYTSHSFRVLHWGSFDRLFRGVSGDDTSSQVAHLDASQSIEESFVLTLERDGSISSQNQQQDYIYRSLDPVFEAMSLYEFVGMTDKEKIKSSSHNLDTEEDDVQPQRRRRGRVAELRGMFSSDQHTQYSTHRLRKRTVWTVPVILGERTPRPDKDAQEKDRWSRMMLILFIPWRRASDLFHDGETWTEAFERQRHSLSETRLSIINNMNVLTECRDARDAFRDMRRAEALALLSDGLPAGAHPSTTGFDESENQPFQLFDSSYHSDSHEYVYELSASQQVLDASIGGRARELVDRCFGMPADALDSCIAHDPNTAGGIAYTIRVQRDDDEPRMLQQSAIMRNLKRQRRPTFNDDDGSVDTRAQKRRRIHDVIENVVTSSVPHANAVVGDTIETDDVTNLDPVERVIEQVVQEMHLNANTEQERAFRIVAHHVHKDTAQLLMYIAGVGGTGKTHVVKAVLRLFDLLGR
ncbi:hypothetical protein C2E23DRAFT_703266, partial [Lenzites betulinus]